MSASQVSFLELGVEIIVCPRHRCHVASLPLDATTFVSAKYILFFISKSKLECCNPTSILREYRNKQYLLDNLKSFTKIINGGVASYSPSLINAQYKILEQDFKIRPDILVIYIDQTDMGDELCRYKNLINLNNKGRIASVKMETFPLYTEVFNLHEKISFSDIDINSSNKIVKTQKYIN